MWRPRIMAKDSEEEKMEEPGSDVTVSFPALIMSGSSSPGFGYGPIPARRGVLGEGGECAGRAQRLLLAV